MPHERGPAVIVVSGTAVIAVCYGLGRYAYGLFVPPLQDALELSVAAVGVIGGLSHAGYGAGLVAAPWLSRRFGSGRLAAGAASVTAVGLASVATSAGPVTLGAAVLVAGLGSGLASPALAEVVVRRLRSADRSPAQTWINSGTSLGLVVSAPAVLLTVTWRVTWAVFALLAVVVAAGARAVLAAGDRPPPARTARPTATAARIRSGGMLAYAVTLGVTSAGYWTFSRQQVLDAGMSDAWSVGFWIAIGSFGLLGGSAGAMADRLGLAGTLRIWSLVWACALGALALPSLPAPLALASAAGFGAAYMALTGLGILWAVSVHADDAAAGVRACFLALGVGQAVATPVVGVVAGSWGLGTTFALSAIASLVLVLLASTAAHQRSRAPAGT